MASKFDQLIAELDRVRDRQPVQKPIPAGAPPGRLPEMQRLGAQLEAMAKSLDRAEKSFGIRKATPVPIREPSEQEKFVKSFIVLHQKVGQAIASGELSRVQQVELQARYGALVDSVMRANKAGPR